MKKIVLLSLFLLMGYQETFSQTWRRVGSWGNQFTDIKWVNEEVAYIAGENIILKTIDGGLSWVEQETPTNHLMMALDFYDEENGLVVGQEGMVYRTTDGGDNWSVIKLGTDSDLSSITYLTHEHIYITGSEGSLFKSTNGGQDWESQILDTTSDLNSIFFVNADSGFIATSNSEIIKTADGGVKWEVKQTDFGAALNDVYFLDDTLGFAVGDQGIIIQTQNAGITWSYINSGIDIDFTQVSFNPSDPRYGVVTGRGGTILRTSNGGLTFIEVSSKTSQLIGGISFRPNANVVYAVGGSGVVISSVNSGGSWSLRFSGQANDFTGVHFLTDSRGYVIGQDGLILLTVNGGTSFTVRSRPLSHPFNAVYFLSNTVGYVAGNNGNIISTTNSGGTWTALNPGTNRNVYGMHYFNINLGYVVGSKGYISKTENRGVNWTTISPGEGSIDYRAISFFNTETGIIVGDGGWVSRSEGGEVWDKTAIPTTENLNAVEILDETSAIVIGNKGIIFKTTDQGKSWVSVKTPFDKNIHDIKFLDESTGFIVGEKGLILKTMDGGETWEQVTTGTFQNFSAISFGDLSTGYAVGENGTFFNYSCMVPETPTTIFGEDDICLSQQIYTVQKSPEPGISYEWRVDGGTILEGQGTARAVIRWDSPGRNAVIVRGQNNCGNGSSTALEVLVSTQPEKNMEIQGNGVVCLSSLEEYLVDSIPGTEYAWEAKGGTIKSGHGTAKIAIEWTDLNQQSLTVAPINACGKGNSVEKIIKVISTPSRPPGIEGPSLVGIDEADYEIEPLPEVNYHWSAGEGGRIVNGQGTGSVRVKWEKEGDFSLTVTPMNACGEGESRTLPINVNIITAINNEEDEAASINIYPSPSSGNIRIFTQSISDIREISIFNGLGQLIHHTNTQPGKSEFQILDLPRGILTVILKSRTKNYVKMIIVH